jgi:alpha-beta hydrolase superfamily lysophospholipase
MSPMSASVAASLPTRPVVIGHSLGGFVVQKYLESHDAAPRCASATRSPHCVTVTFYGNAVVHGQSCYNNVFRSLTDSGASPNWPTHPAHPQSVVSSSTSRPCASETMVASNVTRRTPLRRASVSRCASVTWR